MDSAFWFFMIGILAAFLLFGYQLVISKKIDLPKGWPAFSTFFGGMALMLCFTMNREEQNFILCSVTIVKQILL